MSIKKVALLGADGKLGPAVLDALVSSGFQVTVLKRASSKSTGTYPSGVLVARIQDDLGIDATAEILRGQDAVVVTIKGNQIEVQEKLAQASVKAAVRRFIPADFGSCDSSSQKAQDVVPLFRRKTELRETLIKLADENEGFSWTSLVCGHFFDWRPEFLHLWVKEKRADILDDGKIKWSASTLSRIAEATAAILLRPQVTKNKMIYVQSFCVSQKEVIKAYEQATTSSWQINSFDSKQYEKDEKAKADEGDLEAVANLVWFLGTLDANWETRDGFAMQALGLQDEDLDEVVKRVVKESQ